MRKGSRQFIAVREEMLDGQWKDLDQLVQIAGGTTASVSARVRDLRKKDFGGYIVETRNLGGGYWQYRIAGMK
jgi:hypothetical protein